MIPFSLGSAVMAIVAGITVTRTGRYRGIIWASWAIMIVGWGLMTTVDDHSNNAKKELYPLVAALGVGCLFMTPLITLQAAMPLKDMATSTGAFGFLRTMGGTVGISIGQAIYSSVLKRKINRIPDLSGVDTSPAALAESVRTLQYLPEPQKGQIIHAYAQAISAIWVFNTPVVAVGFLMVLFIKAYSLNQNTIQRGDTHARQSDEEMGAAGDTGGTGEVEGSGADGSVEKSEGHEQSLQGEQERTANNVIDEKKRTYESEKV